MTTRSPAIRDRHARHVASWRSRNPGAESAARARQARRREVLAVLRERYRAEYDAIRDAETAAAKREGAAQPHARACYRALAALGERHEQEFKELMRGEVVD